MAIDPDVRGIASNFAASQSFAQLIQAVVTAEGNITAAVHCSEPSVTTRESAIKVTCRSAVHAMADYLQAKDAEGFVKFWAARWAPVGAANDPKGLNQNWPHNVLKLWGIDPLTIPTKVGDEPQEPTVIPFDGK